MYVRVCIATAQETASTIDGNESNKPSPSGLNDVSLVSGNEGIDQRRAMRFQRRQRAFFVRAH
jgi:hypothetical protein